MPILLSGATSRQARQMGSTDASVQSPLWWVYRLAHRLACEVTGMVKTTGDGTMVWQDGLAKLRRYYDGQFDLPWIKSDDIAVEYAAMIERSRSNFMRLVVDAAAERSVVNGLRLPDDNETADSETWEIWTRNGMQEKAPIAFRTAAIQRRSYLSVWWNNGVSRIEIEDSQQAFVENYPGTTVAAAGIKMWTDDWTGEQLADLYLPNAVHFFRWGKPAGQTRGPDGWYERQPALKNPLGAVTLVPIVNRPDLLADGASELEDVMCIQDRINQTLCNRQINSHLTAFKQKWATGLEIPTDDETGKPVQPYHAAIDKLWVSESEKTKFGEFDASDGDGYHRDIEQDLEHISVITRTPRHVFLHQGQAPSGDAMKSDEAGLVSKVKGQWPSFAGGLLRALTLARRIEGLTTPLTSEIVWGDPEWQTYGQLVDGTTKLVEKRIASLDWAREKVGMTPATIRRVKAELLQEAIEAELLEPTTVTTSAEAAT